MSVADILTIEIDHSQIPVGDLALALANARLDPDGQLFPWLHDYPLVGSVVYYDGGLWTVVDRESGRGGYFDLALVLLIPAYVPGPIEDTRTVQRREVRPVTWTQAQEQELERGAATMRIDDPVNAI